MYDELLQYLLLYGKLPVPGIGTFTLERRPAVADITHRVVNPPRYLITHQEQSAALPRNFFSWLGAQMSVSDHQARERFQQFSELLEQRLGSGLPFTWMGLGVLRKDEGGKIRFESSATDWEAAVPAQKIIRENAEHQIRVGEEMKSSGEMSVMLTSKPPKARYSLLPGLILLVLSMAFIAWFVITKGLDAALQYR